MTELTISQALARRRTVREFAAAAIMALAGIALQALALGDPPPSPCWS